MCRTHSTDILSCFRGHNIPDGQVNMLVKNTCQFEFIKNSEKHERIEDEKAGEIINSLGEMRWMRVRKSQRGC